MNEASIPAEHATILAAVEAFLQSQGPAELLRRDAQHIPPYDFLPKLADLGLIAAPLPSDIGGLNLPWSLFVRILERIGYHAQPVGSMLNRVIAFGIMPLLMYGSEEQRRLLLPPLLEGTALTALALSEPGAGSDARALSTRAQKVPGGWTITGRKSWISDADFATHLMTPCRVAGESKRVFVTLLVPRSATGLSMSLLPKVGNNCMPSYDIGYDAVHVPESLQLGAVGEGFQVITSTLKYSRGSLSALLLGSGQAALELAITHAQQRVQFGRPLMDFEVIRHRLVDMRLELEKARFLVYEYARRLDAQEDVEAFGAMIKIACTEMFQRMTDHGMQILASAGYSSDSPMQMHWRNARLYSIGEGSNEIQREIVARTMGLITRAKP